MKELPTLFDELPSADLRERAEEWIRTHPGMYGLFRRFAGEMLERGRPFGAKALAERVRWESWYQKGDGEEWKINNSFVSYIARKLVEENPALKELIEFRRVNF